MFLVVIPHGLKRIVLEEEARVERRVEKTYNMTVLAEDSERFFFTLDALLCVLIVMSPFEDCVGSVVEKTNACIAADFDGF